MSSKFLNANTDNTLGGENSSNSAVPSQKAVKEYVDAELNTKQDTLTAGSNITINNNTISATVPTVNDNTITITQGGTTKGSFTLNQNNDATIALDAGGGGALADLSDVTITTPANNQGLIYNSTSQEWENGNISAEVAGTTLQFTGPYTTGSTYHPPLFATQWSDHEIQGISWLRADTFSWHSGTTYSTAYAELVSEYNNATNIEININKVGSPTISNTGVASGFSTSNYLVLPDYFAPSTNTWEIKFKVKTPATFTSGAIMDLFNNARYSIIPSRVTETGNIKFWASSNGTSWDIASETTSSNTISANTVYYFRCKFTGTQYLVDISTDDTQWTNYITVNSSLTIFNNTSDLRSLIGIRANDSGELACPWLGSVYLNESYIKINNEVWWTGEEFCRRTSKGYKIALANKEQAILNKYNNTGVAWYYVLDTANTQFKLPRTKYGFEGYRDKVGDYIPESLPNITGGFISPIYYDGTTSSLNGSFIQSYKKNDYVSAWGSGASGFLNTGVDFKASQSSSTYQNNAPVQERSTQMYLYFYVGQFTQTAIEQTAGLNAELFNNKADINANNFNTTGKSLLSSLGMPSSRYVSLTLGASGSTYTAPANGYFTLGVVLSGGSVNLNNRTKQPCVVSHYATSTGGGELILPCQAGDVIKVEYSNLTRTNYFGFLKAEGEPSS